MRLMTVNQFRETYFHPDSRPAASTVRRWVQSKELPGRFVGATCYVDADAWEGERLTDNVRRVLYATA